MTDFLDAATPVAPLASELIAEHHPHLLGQRIEFVFVDPTPKSKGRPVLELAHRPWLLMEQSERVALLDHELSHCTVDEEDGTIGLVGHDVEEFIAVLERRGAWRPELADFLDAGRQLKLVR